MIRIMFLIGQPGIGKSSLSMGLEQSLQDSCDLCVIQNHHDRDYQAEEADAKAKGFSSMQDLEYKNQYGKEKLQESRRKHGKRIVEAYQAHKTSEDFRDFVVVVHVPVRASLEQYAWCREDYQKAIQQAGYEGSLDFLPSLILAPNPATHSKEQVIEILKSRYQKRCNYEEMNTDQPETDSEKIELQRSLDAALPVEKQYEQVQQALEELRNSFALYLDLNASVDVNRSQMRNVLRGIIEAEQRYNVRHQTTQGR